MIWSECFKLIKVKPGRIVTLRFGPLDFADPGLPIDKCQALFEDDFPYLEITKAGMDALYPVPMEKLGGKTMVPAVKTLRKARK